MAKALDEAKAKLVGLASHTSESGGGVSVTRYWKSGTIDYKKIPELKALDLEQYRGRSERRRGYLDVVTRRGGRSCPPNSRIA